MALDPYVLTREQYTRGLIDQLQPASWPQPLKNRVVISKILYDKLAHHEAMAPNLQQTFMTPANSKNRIYFMWDFVGRTLGYCVNFRGVTSLEDMNSAQRALWEDVQGRCELTADLILNTTPGQLNATVEEAYPGQAGSHPDFGSDIVALAQRLKDL